MFISVDLPAPFSPSSAWISPRRRSKSTASFASTPGNCFVMPRSSRTGVTSGIGLDRKGRDDNASPLTSRVALLRGRDDLAAGDLTEDLVHLRKDEGLVGLRDLLAQRGVPDAAVLRVEDRVGVARDAIRVRRELFDREEDCVVHPLQRRREHERAEEALVGVDTDTPDPLLLRRAQAAEPTAAGRLEHDPRAASALALCRDLALRLVVDRRRVR